MKSRNLRRSRPGASALVAGALLLAWAAPSQATPRTPTHVACIGDSITDGAGSSSVATNYPSRLQALLGRGAKVANFGQSGATLLSTGQFPYQQTQNYANATSFAGGAGARAVVDVIILLGANDSTAVNWNPGDAGTRAGQFAVDLAAMVDHFSMLPTHPVVYLALPIDAVDNTYGIRGSVIHDEIIPIILQVAADKGLPTIDLNTPTRGQTSYFTDGVHPNDAGYAVIAGAVHDGLMRVPGVALLSPASGLILPPRATVSMAADAWSDPNLPVTRLEFFAGRTSLRQIGQAPYTFDWSDAPGGAWALTAVATDTTGASATSEPVDIVVLPSLADRTRGCACRAGGGDDRAGVLWAGLVVALVAWRRRRRV